MKTTSLSSGLAILIAAFVLAAASLSPARAADPAAAASPASDLKTEKLSVSGMHCEPCAETITTAVQKVKGVENVTVKFVEKEATVTYHAGATTVDTIIAKIKEAGYDAKKLAE